MQKKGFQPKQDKEEYTPVVTEIENQEVLQEKTGENKKKVERDENGRILPGYTANPNGRPKGTLSITELIKHELEKRPDYLKNKYGENANPEKKRWVELFIEGLLRQAVGRGDKFTQKLIWNYIDGLPKGSFDLTSLGEKIDGVVVLPPKKEENE